MNTLNLPREGDYPQFYSTYISQLTANDYAAQINSQMEELRVYFAQKGKEWADTPYAEGKWSPKEVLGHMLDTERIMIFRALCFARGEKSSLPGFDQDPYVLNARFGAVPLEWLLEDFEAHRKSLLTLLRTLPQDSLDNVGHANGNPITSRALFWIIPGHFIHHFKILKERY